MARGTIKDRRADRKRKSNPTEAAALRVGIGFGHNGGPALDDDDAPKHDHSTVLTADGQINISQSKVKTYRNCRRAFHNKFVLGIQRKKKTRPLMFGSIVHEIIEAQLEGKKWRRILKKYEKNLGPMFRKEREMYGNILVDIGYIMEDYFEHWEGTLRPIEHDGRFSEFEFRIELDSDLWFTGKIDTIGRARKMKWLVEHKTFSRMPSEDERWRSVQAAVYFRAAEEMGFPALDGVLWDYISSKPCNVPGELTATGKISQARIDTLPSRIEAWIEEEGHKRKDFKKMLADAEANRRNRFVRLYSPVKPRIVDNIWNDFVDTAKEIQDNFGKKSDQNIGRHCSWCDYQALCKAEVTDSDLEWILKRDYQSEDQSHKGDQKDRTDD